MLRVDIVAYEEPFKPLQQKTNDFKTFLPFLPEESDKLGCHTGVI